MAFTPATTLTDFLARITHRTVRIGIVGMGYVGLPLTLLFAEQRIAVTGLEIDEEKVRTLNAGQSYIHRIEPAHIAAAQQSGFIATTDFAAMRTLDVVLICVPTPLYPDHTPDMRSVLSTMQSLVPHLRPGQLVILESTTYPGTTEEIVVKMIEEAGHHVLRASTPAEPGDEPLNGILVAFSPEREDPGNTLIPRRNIPKVVGGVNAIASTAACALYATVFEQTVPMSSPAAAELTKLLENIYRSVNIALVNEMKQLCQRMGIDIWEVLAAAATKPFGFQPFQPGPGVGGHCIPVDPFYLSWKARQFGFDTRFIALAGEVNESMPAYVVETTRTALAARNTPLAGAKILVLGVAYKRDVDDLRESPALTVINLLRNAGALVAYNDPFFPRITSGRKYDLHLTSTPVVQLAQYACVMILTDHTAYDYPRIVAESNLVIDTRNATRNLPSPNTIRC